MEGSKSGQNLWWHTAALSCVKLLTVAGDLLQCTQLATLPSCCLEVTTIRLVSSHPTLSIISLQSCINCLEYHSYYYQSMLSICFMPDSMCAYSILPDNTTRKKEKVSLSHVLTTMPLGLFLEHPMFSIIQRLQFDTHPTMHTQTQG